MFVILTYDIKAKRVSKIMKICRKYLTHIQKSVFEGSITEAKLEKLKKEIFSRITPGEDSVIIYEFESVKYSHKDRIGVTNQASNII